MARDAEIGTVTVGVVPDAEGIEQKLRDQIVPGAERVGEEAGTEMSDAIEEKMDTAGSKSADKFGERFRTRLKAALDNLPEAKVEGDVSDIDRKLAEVRLEIKSLQDQPLIDKRDTALALDQIMLKVAELKAEAASGIEIPVDTKSMISDYESALAKIRGKAVSGALVPGGMFPQIPFSAPTSQNALAATQSAIAASVDTMDEVLAESKALQAASSAAEQAAAIDFTQVKSAGDYWKMRKARDQQNAQLQSYLQHLREGGEASSFEEFLSLSQPQEGLVPNAPPTTTEDVTLAVKDIAREITGAVTDGQSGITDATKGIVDDVVKPVDDIAKSISQDAIKSESWRTRFFNLFKTGFDDVKKMATDINKVSTLAKSSASNVVGGLRGLVGLGSGAGLPPGLAGGEAIPEDVISAIEARMTSGVGVTGELNKFAAFLRSPAAKAMGTGPSITPELISAIEDRMKSGVSMTGELNRFAKFLTSDAGKLLAGGGTEGLLTAFGAGGGDLTKLLGEFGAKGTSAATGDLLRAFGAGGGNLGKLLKDFGMGGEDIAAVLGEAVGGGAGGGGGIISKLGGFFGGLPGNIGGLVTGGLGKIPLAGGNPWIGAGIGGAALSTLPFIGQGLAGGIVGGLGTGLAGMGILGAIMSGKLSTQFSGFAGKAKQDLVAIGEPMIPVVHNILSDIIHIMNAMTPIFKLAESIIAGPLQVFTGTLIKAFGQPAVKDSIEAVAKAFGALLNAMTPNIVQGIGAIANSITNMANAVAANPRPFADFINFLFGIVNAAIETVAWLTRVADWIEKQRAFWGAISGGFDEVIYNIKEVIDWLGHFQTFWQLVWATAKSYFDIFMAELKIGFDEIGTYFHVASDIIHGRWGNIVSDITTGAKGVVPIVKTAMGQVSNAVLGALGVHHAAVSNTVTTHHTNVVDNLTKTQDLFLAHSNNMAGIASRSAEHTASRVHKHAATHLTNTQNLFRAHSENMTNVATGGTAGRSIAANMAQPFIDGWNAIYHATDVGIKDVGKLIHFGTASFDAWWKTHGMVVKGIWDGIVKTIKVAAGVVAFLLKFAMAMIGAMWKMGWDFLVGIVKAAVAIIGGVVKAAMDAIVAIWKFGWELVKDALKIAWDIIVGIINVALDLFQTHWSQAWTDIQATFRQVWNSFKDIFKTAWQTLVTAVDIAFGLLKTTFINGGGDIIHGLFTGITDALSDIGNWVKTNIYNPIVNHIKSAFGISSPAKTMKPIGSQIITGVFHGMIAEGKNIETFAAKIFNSWPKAILSFVSKGLVGGMSSKLASFLGSTLGWVGGLAGSAASKAAGFFGKVFSLVSGGSSGGVARWASTVSKALTMLGLPQSLSPEVLYQMQTESGGNPNAINLWDSNARAGHPSQGLMQTIPSTFQAYHVAGTSWNILDPLANIAAALNYAKHNRGFGTGPGQVGSGHGYDSGGWLPAGLTLAMNNTGQPERILTDAQWNALANSGGPEYHAHFDGLTTQAIQAEVRTAFNMMSLTQGHLARPGRRT